MTLTEFISVSCPYCGESFDLPVDQSAGDQDYIEDCQVCCNPMNVSVTVDADGEMAVIVRSEDE